MNLSLGTASVTVILIATLLGSGCQSLSSDERQISQPNVTWAAPSRVWAVRLEKPGLPNLYRVSDDLYRGAQPTAEGFPQLKAMGVKTVINLRFFHNDQSKIAGADLAYEEIPMNAWHIEDEDAVRFLNLVADRSRAPFFVYCHYGADRTGLMCAVYRIAVQGWTKDEAIAEMTQGGFGFHAIWKNLVRYLRKLDVEKLTADAMTENPLGARAGRFAGHGLFDRVEEKSMRRSITVGRAPLFQTAWCVESPFTPTLIIHVIRTNRIPFIQSLVTWSLILTSVIIVAVGAWLTVSPLAKTLGFVPLPAMYWPFLAILLPGCAILTQVVKTWFIRRFGE